MLTNLQVFGIKNSFDTKKAERFFKERNINYHFRDLSEKGISKGELESILRNISIEDLIDKEGKQYKKRNLAYMKYDIEKELLEDPLLFKVPIVRIKNKAIVGYEPEKWSELLNEFK